MIGNSNILLFIIVILFIGCRTTKISPSNQHEIAKVSDEKKEIKKNLDSALLRLDSINKVTESLVLQLKKLTQENTTNKPDSALLRLDSIKKVSESLVLQLEKLPQGNIINKHVINKLENSLSIIIPVFYATDRQATGSKNIYEYYGPKRNSIDKCQHGIVEISIPTNHEIGMLELPSWWNFNKRDTSKYFVVKKNYLLTDIAFFNQMKAEIQQSDEKDLFIFIHGFNSTFIDAAERTAQLAYDLGFKGVPIMYSWPSAGSLTEYVGDEGNVEWTVPHLKDFLTDVINRTDAKKINIIAHSMGNRAISMALNQIALPRDILFNQIILAAPDIDADIFKRDIAPNILNKCKRMTIYSSSKDEALQASKKIHSGISRVGETGSHIFTIKGIETVDASSIDTPDFFNHSYFMQSRPIIDDILKIFKWNAKPSDRNLLLVKNRLGNYWTFKR